MRILNVGHNYHVRGGSDRYMLELGALLSSRGHEVIPFAARSPDDLGSPWSAFFPAGVDTTTMGVRSVARYMYSAGARRSLVSLLAKGRVDLAHLHIYYGQLTGSILAPLARRDIPIVQTLHEYKLTCPVYTHLSHGAICEACRGSAHWRALRRRCKAGSFLKTVVAIGESYVSRWLGNVRLVDHFIAPSAFLRDLTVRLGVLAPERISTIHNFVDVDSYDPCFEPGGYLLYFGRLTPEKGLETLMRAVMPLRNVTLHVVGDGPERAVLETMAARNQCRATVRMLGHQSGGSLRELIRRCAAVVVPSEWYENCPMSIVEAMAYGKPVVASTIGGIPVLVLDGESGLLFPPGDAEALRERIALLLTNPGRARTFGIAAREEAERRLSAQIHYEKLMALYGKFRV